MSDNLRSALASIVPTLVNDSFGHGVTNANAWFTFPLSVFIRRLANGNSTNEDLPLPTWEVTVWDSRGNAVASLADAQIDRNDTPPTACHVFPEAVLTAIINAIEDGDDGGHVPDPEGDGDYTWDRLPTVLDLWEPAVFYGPDNLECGT